MTNRTNLRLLALCLLTAFVLLGVSLLNQTAAAQDQPRQLKAGEEFEVGGGQSVEVIQCRGDGRNQECEVQFYRGNTPEGKAMWQWAGSLLAGEARVRAEKETAARAQARADRRAGNAAEKTTNAEVLVATKKETADEPATTADCSFAAPPGDTSRTAKPSEQLFKRKIYDNYHVKVNGTISAPLKLGVTFLSFQLGEPFTNIVRVDPAVGAYRVNDAAPVNATIYPVKSEHIVCEQYRDGTSRRRVANKYACFKNRDGEWVCGADGIPKITKLN